MFFIFLFTNFDSVIARKRKIIVYMHLSSFSTNYCYPCGTECLYKMHIFEEFFRNFQAYNVGLNYLYISVFYSIVVNPHFPSE